MTALRTVAILPVIAATVFLAARSYAQQLPASVSSGSWVLTVTAAYITRPAVWGFRTIDRGPVSAGILISGTVPENGALVISTEIQNRLDKKAEILLSDIAANGANGYSSRIMAFKLPNFDMWYVPTSKLTVDLNFPIAFEPKQSRQVELMIPIDRASADFRLHLRGVPPLLILNKHEIAKPAGEKRE